MAESVFGIAIPENLEWSTSFQNWIKQWNAVTDVPTAIGLLHNIFRANEGEEGTGRSYTDHRILFLLKLASGHRTNSRSGLAPKAFAVLTQEFLRYANFERIQYLSREVDEAFLDFFLDGNVRWNDANAPQSNQITKVDQLASTFMQQFLSINWDMGDDVQRVRIVEVLSELHALDSLIPSRKGSEWDRFTEPVMQKLEEVVQQGIHPVDYETSTPSLEEQVCHGSSAARALLMIRAGKAGHDKEKEKKALKEQVALASKKLAAM